MRTLKFLAIAATAALATPSMAATYTFNGPVNVPGFPFNIVGAGPASTFPIEINVSGAGPVTEDVDLVLTNLKHSYADDLAIALQGPTGLAILILTDAGGHSNFNGTYTFNQGSAALGGGNYGGNNTNIPGGTYGPSVYGINPIANLLTSGSSLSAFNGLNPNGTWKLWVWDDNLGNVGSLQSVSLKIAAVPEPATWAMMIGGLGLVGLQMRRRKTAVSFA
jgi:subtilisin-like proprotein convertase family protein